jgi:hypothetical protein
MKRRTLFKTGLFGFLGFCLPTAAKAATTTSTHLSFETFFLIVNGFEMNRDQKEYYRLACNNARGIYSGRRQTGMSTLLTTMALYDEKIKNKSVMVITATEHMKKHRIDMRNRMIDNLQKYYKIPLNMVGGSFRAYTVNNYEFRYGCCGVSIDSLYIEDDMFQVSKSPNYKYFRYSMYPVVNYSKNGKIHEMGTYDYTFSTWDIKAPNYKK